MVWLLRRRSSGSLTAQRSLHIQPEREKKSGRQCTARSTWTMSAVSSSLMASKLCLVSQQEVLMDASNFR